MNILFLTTGNFKSINDHSIYPDLLREFKKNGHKVYIVCPNEHRTGKKTEFIQESGACLLRVKTGNLTKINMIEKGVSTMLIGTQYKLAINKYFSDVKFDLVLYSTPPITLVGVIEFIKRRDGAITYLLLKDIFPQNAVDIGILCKNGIKGLLYKYFRKQEKELYHISDRIGCMSPANVNYLLHNNPEVNPSIVEVCPNCIEVIDKSVNAEQRKKIREKYGIPINKKVFVYGGNLGKPQGIPFIIECLEKCKNIDNAVFLVVGDGTEYGKLQSYAQNSKQENFILMSRLPKDDYDTLVGACDVGLIFLDHRFTIPNFPSRLLSYMQAKLPVLAVTDPHSDVGEIIEQGEFGWWCESDDSNRFAHIVQSILDTNLETAQEKAYQFLIDHYSVENAYMKIINQ